MGGNDDDAGVAPTVTYAQDKSEQEVDEAAALSPEDFYFDGDFMVFTAAYHLKRGYCCNSDCRHCPYR